MTVKRGLRDVQEVGQVIKFNGESEMNVWDGMPCNQIKGSDTTIYPPFMNGSDDIWSFSTEICRYKRNVGVHSLNRVCTIRTL